MCFRFNKLIVVFALLLGPFVGCEGAPQQFSDAAAEPSLRGGVDKLESEGLRGFSATGSLEGSDAKPGDSGVGSALQEADEDQLDDRKIIYTANISIVVQDFEGVDEAIDRLVDQYDGYIDSEDLSRLQGQRRHGTWTVRVPVANYSAFLKAAADLGVPTSQRQDAQDVTEEFVDLQARLDNKRRLEERILQLLDRADDKLENVIQVERELARVREEIERLEGRLRYLTDRTRLTTVTISVREEQEFRPPQTPTLANRIQLAWQNSVQRFRNFCEDALVYLVANAITIIITLALIVIGLIVLRVLWRRIFRRSGQVHA